MIEKATRHSRKVRQVSLFSERLKALRIKRGFKNQTSFAKALGVHQTIVSMYEKGGREPMPSMLVKMAEALGTTTDYLVGRTDDPDPPVKLSDRERRLLDLMRAQGGQLTFDDIANFWLDNMPELPEDK